MSSVELIESSFFLLLNIDLNLDIFPTFFFGNSTFYFSISGAGFTFATGTNFFCSTILVFYSGTGFSLGLYFWINRYTPPEIAPITMSDMNNAVIKSVNYLPKEWAL